MPISHHLPHINTDLPQHGVGSDHDSEGSPTPVDDDRTPTNPSHTDSSHVIASFPHDEPGPSHTSSHLHTQEELGHRFPPSSESEVAHAVNSNSHEPVTLWRGTTKENAENVRRFGTAGGTSERNENIHRPTEAEAFTQSAGGSLAPGSRAERKPTEYTTARHVAQGFGSSGRMVAVQVDPKYLTKGSGTEGGWAIHHEAPVKFLGAADGEFATEGEEHHSVPDAG